MSALSTPPHRFDPGDHPPGASPVVRRVRRLIVRPLERFLSIEASSGIILLAAALLALGWANSPWAGSYHRLLETPLSIGVDDHVARVSAHFFVNDILMSVFFLVVGLEIRRETHSGELSDLRRATLPVVAAIGGMAVPALIYLAVAPAGASARGWGVPMATDIAFAVGVLALLGKRIPPALRVLLLALAIIDDIGAILVIALFYSTGIELIGFAIGAAGLVGFLALRALGVRSISLYLVPAVVLWSGVLTAGVHPTIAGVITGLLIPTRRWPGHEEISPGENLEHALHPWVAYVIMPVFALANAGVDLGGVEVSAAPGVALGVGAGLVVGKLVGVVGACALAVKLGIAALPRGVSWRGIIVVGTVAGIGFTMALFIAALAFTERADLHAVAKMSVLCASGVSAILALILGRVLLTTTLPPGAATSADDAESSTES